MHPRPSGTSIPRRRQGGTCRAALLGLALAALPLATHAQPFHLVAHPEIGAEEIRLSDLRGLYLGEEGLRAPWGSTQPIDLPPESTTRQTFSALVLGRTIAQVDALWQRRIFEGTGVPPARMASPEDVLAHVGETPASIGYVPADAAVPGGLQRLALVVDNGAVPSRRTGDPPSYPPLARRARAQGTVILEVRVDPQGRVEWVEIVQDQPYGMGKAAVQAVEGWVFEPLGLAGSNVSAIFRLPIDFRL